MSLPAIADSILAAAAPFDVWTYLGDSLPAGAVLNAVGVGAFVVAILSDRLMTKGQHLRRVTDITDAHKLAIAELTRANDQARIELTRHYEDLAAEKDRAYAELKESRNGYKEATQTERARADKVTDQLAQVVELAELTNHLLGSFNEAAKGVTP